SHLRVFRRVDSRAYVISLSPPFRFLLSPPPQNGLHGQERLRRDSPYRAVSPTRARLGFWNGPGRPRTFQACHDISNKTYWHTNGASRSASGICLNSTCTDR